MVVGHYQPLADDGPRDPYRLRTVRPNLSSAVGAEDEDKQTYMRPPIAISRGG